MLPLKSKFYLSQWLFCKFELIVDNILPNFLLNFSERCKFASSNFSERCKKWHLNFSERCKNGRLNFSERCRHYGNEKKDLSATP